MIRPACGTKQELGRSQRLWRKTHDGDNYRTWDAELRRWLPTLAYNNFQFDKDWSAVWGNHMEEVHETTSACAADEDYPTVWEVSVGPVRELGFTVNHSPEGPTPLDCAHCSAWWPTPDPNREERKALRTDLSKLLRQVHNVTPDPPEPKGA